MEAGISIKLIFYFATNCPRRIVRDELSATSCPATNCLATNCPRRIVRDELSCDELSATNCPATNCPVTFKNSSNLLQTRSRRTWMPRRRQTTIEQHWSIRQVEKLHER